MKVLVRFIRLFVLFLLISSCLPAIGQANPANAQKLVSDFIKKRQTKDFNDTVQQYEQEIEDWKVESRILLTFDIVIITCGAVIVYLHGARSKRARNAVLILAITTSSLTAIKALIWPADYQTLRRSVRQGKEPLTHMRSYADDIAKVLSITEEDFETLSSEFKDQQRSFEILAAAAEGRMPEGFPSIVRKSAVGFYLFNIRVVNAQSDGTPSWVENPPTTTDSFYFVGRSTANSLTDAKAASYDDAINHIIAFLGQGPPYRATESQSAFIRSASSIQDTFFNYNQQSNSYSYYYLLRISKKNQPSRPSMLTYRQKDWYPIDLAYDPVAGLFVLDKDGFVSKIVVDESSISIQKVFPLPRTWSPDALAATREAIYVSANNNDLGCKIFRRFLPTNETEEVLLTSTDVGKRSCKGIATDGTGIFLVIADLQEIRFWPIWNHPGQNFREFSSEYIGETSTLGFDHPRHQLIYTDISGSAYTLSIKEWKPDRITSNLGLVQSISDDSDNFLFASGKKILFYSKANYHWQQPPASMRSLNAGLITGVAVDSSGAAWIIDRDRGTIQGPFPLN
ncbi:hypothetical protein H7849_19350 [Alloacidobacterium dinghuense]|uniref:Uncharacterized protein n=1 Tax=Alloacidobacterium dinghuense TaxID=2763107 RepID=A0A7G8BFA9_9BACT|nr:hypothetical protein [Alloacidobacterium dinghuense]QNI31229.1 hypothetical protein H7849_19350 [Alloacidobacterium dinghuense]